MGLASSLRATGLRPGLHRSVCRPDQLALPLAHESVEMFPSSAESESLRSTEPSRSFLC